MNTQIEIPKGWTRVSSLALSDTQKHALYKAVKDGKLPSIKMPGPKFAAVFIPEEMANEYLSGSLETADQKEINTSKVLDLIKSGEVLNCKIAKTLNLSRGAVTNYVKELVDKGIVEVTRKGYFMTASVVPKPTAAPTVDGVIDCLVSISRHITGNQEATGGRIETLIATQQETNRLLGELLKVWGAGK